MPTVTLTIAINTFRPITAPYPIDASMTMTQGDPETFSFDVKTQGLTITVPSQQMVQIIYQLPDPHYVLLGIAFNPPKQGCVGRAEFPTVSLNRDPSCSQMFVADTCLKAFNGVSFDYVVLVQEVASGNIGIIDPDIDTEVEN